VVRWSWTTQELSRGSTVARFRDRHDLLPLGLPPLGASKAVLGGGARELHPSSFEREPMIVGVDLGVDHPITVQCPGCTAGPCAARIWAIGGVGVSRIVVRRRVGKALAGASGNPV
jgi:hypothetical protein